MNKKHFNALAKALANTHPGLDATEASLIQWGEDVEAVSRVCSDDNPRFNWHRFNVCVKLSAYYTEKFGGNVRCIFDSARWRYEIRGEGLTPRPDLKDMYPNGWSLLDYITPEKAEKILEGRSENE